MLGVHRMPDNTQPRPDPSPLYAVVFDAEPDPQAAEIVVFGGYPFKRTNAGWMLVEHIELRAVRDED